MRVVARLQAGGSIPAKCRDSSVLHSVQTGSGAHPASYPMGTEHSSPGLKRSKRELYSSAIREYKSPFRNMARWQHMLVKRIDRR
jgi:hypothetical protein